MPLFRRSRSTRAKKSPWTSSRSRSRKESPLLSSLGSGSRPKSPYGASGLRPPALSDSGRPRSKSESRHFSISNSSRPGTSGRRYQRSVSPRHRPLSPRRPVRHRPRRDSSISGDDSTPLPRRPSVSPPYDDRVPRSGPRQRRPSLSPARYSDRLPRQDTHRASHQYDPIRTEPAPLHRPPVRPQSPSHPTEPRPSYGSRPPSYSIPQVVPPSGARPLTPPRYRSHHEIHDHPEGGRAARPTHRGEPRSPRHRYRDPVEPRSTNPNHSPRRTSAARHDDRPQRPGHKKPEPYPTAKPPPGPASPSSTKPNKAYKLFEKLPEALAAYSGLEMLRDHADSVKEWTNWLNDIRDAPEEIHSLSAKVQTAADTVTQIQNTLEARPDLVEGEAGQRLREQIETSVKNTNEVLGKMAKVLEDLSRITTADSSVMSGVQEFYQSYRYRSEWEAKIKEADAELQKELVGLSTLMINLYSRAIMKPSSSGTSTPIPPPIPNPDPPTKETKETRVPPIQTDTPKDPDTPQPVDKGEPVSTKLEPPPIGNMCPRSPSVLGEEEAKIGVESPPSSEPRPAETEKKPASDADTEKQPNWDDALLDACFDGDLEGAVEALKHTSVKISDRKGFTPLHLASERDKLAIVMMLLDRGADPNALTECNRTPLHLASRFASPATVELLLDDAHADPNARTSAGQTCLHEASRTAEDGDEERREVVRLLRDFGADPTITDAKGRTARDIAQKRDYWNISSTLRRAEKRWEEEHHSHGWSHRHRMHGSK